MKTRRIVLQRREPSLPTLTYKIENKNPIELLDLTSSLMAIGEEFKRYVSSRGADVREDDVRLFIKEIRPGSIVAELVGLAQQYTLIPPELAWVIQFANHLDRLFEFFKGDDATLEDESSDGGADLSDMDKSEYDRLSQIVEPVAKDSGSQLNIIANTGSTVNVNLHISSNEANAIQNRIRRYRDALPEKLTGIQHDQVLYWYQVRDDSVSKPGDRAVIPRIYPKPVKVQFASDAVKTQMIGREENPFRLLYVVDVDVTEIDSKPVLYRILDVKDSMNRED